MTGEEVITPTSFLNPLVDNNYASARMVSTRILHGRPGHESPSTVHPVMDFKKSPIAREQAFGLA
jgi:hypothetical protein